MNCKTYLAAAVFSLSLLCSGTARAMSIHDFGRLNDDDEATYVTFMVEGAAKMFKAHGQPDQAEKTINLFKDSGKNGGVSQFAFNLRTINALNNRNAINPNNRVPVYGVENAMEQTLKDAGIIVPVSYLLTIGKDFIPAGPPRLHILGQ
jgi:hypothetical protein